MLQVCIFVPFLHSETPKPSNVPKQDQEETTSAFHHGALFQMVMDTRQRLAIEQTKRQHNLQALGL